jgi:YHS domain-containing protein
MIPRTTRDGGGSDGDGDRPGVRDEIDSAAAAASEEYEGKTYYFCSEGCHQRFIAAPEQYAV